MRGMAKIVGPLGLVIFLSGVTYMGWNWVMSLLPIAVGALLVAVALFERFRWDIP